MSTRTYHHGMAFIAVLVLALGSIGVMDGFGADRIDLGRQTNFKIFPESHAPLPGDPQGARPVKTMIQGASARYNQDETVLVKSMWLGSFERDGTTNLFAMAPECLVDITEKTATSPGPLEIQTGNGQLAIRGTGFFCQLTNIVLVISNDVETTVQRDLMRASRRTGSVLVSELVPEGESTNEVAATNLPLRVFADRFVFDQASNTVVYTGRVRAEDPAFVLTSHRLIITLTTNGNVDRIQALEDVALRTADGTREAFGDEALYVLSRGDERIEIEGSPARWTDGPRSGHGASFFYDPATQLLRSHGTSFVRVPKSDLMQPRIELTGPAEGETDAVRTNEFVEITAGYLETLPAYVATNLTGRTLLASNDVVIVSPSDQGRASGRYATYSELTGLFELHGEAAWAGEDEREVKGDSFHFNQTNQTFQVLGQSYLKLPMSSFGSNSPVAGMFQGSSTNRENAGADYLEIHSDHIHYETNRLHFGDQVRMFLRRGDELLGRMNCRLLTLWMTNREVGSIVAERDVLMEQLPMLAGGSNRVEKSLSSEWFTVFMNTNGLIREMVAQTNVLIRQVEHDPTKTVPIKTDLSSETVTAFFAPDTNTVERIVADGNVVIDQPAGKATCHQAVYTQASNNLMLEGDVRLERPQGLLNAPAVLLRHFNLWPGRVNRLNVPLRAPGGSDNSRTNRVPGAASSAAIP